jgi:protocatechuate 3,4-dioxygenase beta subunit
MDDWGGLDEEDRGLRYDVQTLMDRRRSLGVLGAVTLAGVLGAATLGAPGAAAAPIAEVPDETNGPFPADGSNGVDVLDDRGIVRRDIRSSFGTSTTTAAGVPLAVRLRVLRSSTGAPLKDAAVYVWHCDRDGNYSMYSAAARNENYLRGVQPVSAAGVARFRTIFPGCYSGRWPHIHFEVYSTLADATGSGPIVKTSQIALPESACDEAYATSGYSSSVANLARVSLASDNVFGDDEAVHQLATMTGNPMRGYVASLTIGV